MSQAPFKPIRLDYENCPNSDPTFQPIKTIAWIWGTNRKGIRRVVAHIVLTYRNHATLIPGRPVWQVRDADTSSPVAESFESPENLKPAARTWYLGRRARAAG